ncbi:hypothetical protein ArsFIN_06400 [Arsenophonus nasoniae]|uniref:Lipoprotein n=1 Tax=Arsenophonus nasoniae TaxID=638 RepID=D2U243_9GAMM|nr:hypothetical protein ArsFIN_06400 [Arsenophonus nasoniae]CBA75002.1 hypothetical protein ARN_26480 [Arsenophonus nasoniae]
MRLLLCCLVLCISGCNLLSPTEYNKQDNSLKKTKKCYQQNITTKRFCGKSY